MGFNPINSRVSCLLQGIARCAVGSGGARGGKEIGGIARSSRK